MVVVVNKRIGIFFFRSVIVLGLIGVFFALAKFAGNLFWACVLFGLIVVYLVGVVDGEVGVWK